MTRQLSSVLNFLPALPVLVLALLVLAAPTRAAELQPDYKSLRHDFAVGVVAEGLDTPWGMNWLRDGDALLLLVTERPGQLRFVYDSRGAAATAEAEAAPTLVELEAAFLAGEGAGVVGASGGGA